jgi:hypothetical protein
VTSEGCARGVRVAREGYACDKRGVCVWHARGVRVTSEGCACDKRGVCVGQVRETQEIQLQRCLKIGIECNPY